MDTKKLRQKILDLAIHGKLVPQDPNDEPASVLLERIRAEKERLIAEGKIKRSKKSATSDTSHYENVPFEVPDGWCWSCIENVCSKFTTGPFGSMVHKSDYVIDGGVPIVNPANMIGGNISYNKLMFVSELRAKDLQRYRLEPSDILLARRGDLTKCVVIKEEQKDWLCGTGSFVLHTILLLPTYFELLYSSTYIQSILTSESIGATMDNLNQGLLSSIIIPIPPIEEQKRIVTTVGLWFSLIENLEVEYSELNQNISKAKSKILDLAIHGKLVPQDPNDEPASELLKRINPKFVPCDNPHYENVPFVIPSNWVWVKLGDITNYGKCSTCSVDDIHKESWILELEDIEKDTGRVLVRHSKAERVIKGARHSFYAGNILYSKLRTYLNKVLVAKEDGFCTTEIIPIECCDSVHPDYICNILRSKYFLDYTAQCGYGVKMPRLSTTDARKALIPLPPYKEQIRISEKIDVLMGSLNSIAESLN